LQRLGASNRKQGDLASMSTADATLGNTFLEVNRRRCYDRRSIKTPVEQLCADFLARHFCRFVGLQPAYGITYTLVLFKLPEGVPGADTTAAIRLDRLNDDAIRAKIEEVSTRFSGFTSGEIADANLFQAVI